jgi:uncharacterized damage-inducible protein DinB
MKRTPWFERTFPAVDDNGRLPGILERLEGTPHRLRALLAGVDRSGRVDTGWSLAQELGHLNDLEPLWLQRCCDIIEGKADLTAADLSNRKTHESDHDRRPLSDHIDRFERNRMAFVSKLREASDSDLARAAKHPRLGTPMRLIDLALFVAEHDDHHLARLRELKAYRGTHSPGLRQDDVRIESGTV